jgi:hypothetical protein
VLPFWLSIGVLSLVQGAVVAAPRAIGPLPARLRSRRWALVPPASVIVFVLVASAAERASADGLTYLAALALGLLAHRARPVYALAVPVLFLLAWADRGGLAADAAALALSALSCVALGALLAAVTPPRWLAAGVVAMALADTALVVSDLLQRPNNALNAAHPAAGLPRLQTDVFGSAVMGYGDLFVAGVLGGLLACGAAGIRPAGAALPLGPRAQRRGALLTAVLAVCFDLLFFFVDELPATVPVAMAMIVTIAVAGRRSAAPRSAPATAPEPARARPAHRARAAP